MDSKVLSFDTTSSSSAKGYNLYNIELKFKESLVAGNISRITIKNYLSDLRYFFGWYRKTFVASNQEDSLLFVQSISEEELQKYRNGLISDKMPENSINRRLSSLRKFFSFCVAQEWIHNNPTHTVLNTNIIQETAKAKGLDLLVEFEHELENAKLKMNTKAEHLANAHELINYIQKAL